MANRKPVYVQLEAGEDVPSVRDRLSFIRGQQVLLIWPESGTALTRKLDLVLIQREAKRRALQIALVTHDPVVIENATELNISTFETIGASEKARWKRGRTKVFIPRYHKPEDEPEPEELMPVASRVKNPRRRLPPLQSLLLRIIVLGILLVVIGVTVYIVAPGATVTLTLAQSQVSVDDINITADPKVLEIDIENGIIPATVLQTNVETTGTIDTTGVDELRNVPSTGRVTFTNQTNQAVVIPANTNVSTSAGTPILFKTVEEVTVPAGVGQTVEVDIEALANSSGDASNVASGLINTVIGPLDDDVTVRNLSPTTGGETRVIATVTQADYDSLRAKVRGQLQSLAFTEMEANLTPTQFIIIETIRIPEGGEREDWTTFSHQVGDISGTLTLTMRAVVEAVAVDDSFAQQVTLARLSAQLPFGRIIQPETITYTRGGVTNIADDLAITFTASSSGWVSGQVNTLRLQERLAGKSLTDAEQILQAEVDLEEGSTPMITLWPPGFDQMPQLPVRINVQVASSTP